MKSDILNYTEKLGLGIGIVGLFNIQFIVDREENVYIIEVNPRSSRTVPFLSKATGYSLGGHRHLCDVWAAALPSRALTELYPEGAGTVLCEGARRSPSPSWAGWTPTCRRR